MCGSDLFVQIRLGSSLLDSLWWHQSQISIVLPMLSGSLSSGIPHAQQWLCNIAIWSRIPCVGMCLIESKQRKFINMGNNVDFLDLIIFSPGFLNTDSGQAGINITAIGPHRKLEM